ncbi:hypothetical protein [Paenisporosarcina cavernae]|uniref:Uncharacterized protein n=1 Tax=Paenisporosarcina cavernae TaxID=2320858 RepID=A0A385YSM6_9BACL|nr:hypothetical protein [Paenisporosarcina cavernae]AYC29666.1 hypothetical protein D3873_07095 [Paenisporosarcina cavernae]
MTKTHGQSGTKLYYIWVEMRQRCGNSDHPKFKLYGGRGIQVCGDWERFENFYAWAKKVGYREGLSLDRINNNDGYYPNNCRWANQYVQMNNTRTNKYIKYRGKTQSLAKWAKELNLNYNTLRSRSRLGWTAEEMFETPTLSRNHARN